MPGLITGLVAFALCYLLARVVSAGIRASSTRLGRHRNLAVVLSRLAQWLLLLLGLLIAVTIVFPSFTPGDLDPGPGDRKRGDWPRLPRHPPELPRGSPAAPDRAVPVGDQIIYGAVEGTVEEIQTRATMVRTYDGRRVVVPNSKLFTDTVIVNTAFPERRVECDVGIGVSDDVECARGSLRRTEGVIAQPSPEVLVFELGDFAVKLRARWWVHPPRKADVLEARD